MTLNEDHRDGFSGGIIYERVRILESLRLLLKPALARVAAKEERGEPITVADLSIHMTDVFTWANQIIAHPVHTVEQSWAEADNAVEAYEREAQGDDPFADMLHKYEEEE